MSDEAAPVQKNGGDESTLHIDIGVARDFFIQGSRRAKPCLWCGAEDAAPEAKAFRIPDQLPLVTLA